jgi:hypothetical protein
MSRLQVQMSPVAYSKARRAKQSRMEWIANLLALGVMGLSVFAIGQFLGLV